MPNFVCKKISNDEEFADARRIRIQVFVEEQHIPADMEFDEADQVSIHVIGIEDGVPVATGRVVRPASVEDHSSGSTSGGHSTPEPADESHGSGQLSRIAVLPGYRGRGYAKTVVRTLEDLARSEGIESLFLYPHIYLDKFYASLGYETVPGVTDEVAGHPLILMKKNL